MDKRVGLAIKKVHDQVAASSHPSLPLMWTEWNVPSSGPLNARDTIDVGPVVADDESYPDDESSQPVKTMLNNAWQQ